MEVWWIRGSVAIAEHLTMTRFFVVNKLGWSPSATGGVGEALLFSAENTLFRRCEGSLGLK